jgi:hypothetical protein
MYSCMVGSYAASTMPTTMVRTYYVQDADCRTTYKDRLAPTYERLASREKAR